MATSRSEPVIWPYEYQGWKVTFFVYHRDTSVTPRPPASLAEVTFAQPKVEHLHAHPKQSVRWTRKGKDVWLAAQQGWKVDTSQEQLCCFICAEYMPDEVYQYFERCREMTRCAMMGG